MSALSTLCNNKAFLEKVCVARDEKVGVYGFVFFRGTSKVWMDNMESLTFSKMENGYRKS